MKRPFYVKTDVAVVPWTNQPLGRKLTCPLDNLYSVEIGDFPICANMSDDDSKALIEAIYAARRTYETELYTTWQEFSLESWLS